MKFIVTLVPINFGYKLTFLPFLSFRINQNKDHFFKTLLKNVLFLRRNEKYFCILFIASRALLERQAEFNRPL